MSITIDGVTLLNIIEACKVLKEHLCLIVGRDESSFDVYAVNDTFSKMVNTTCFAVTTTKLPTFSFHLLQSSESISQILPILSYEINDLGIFQTDNNSCIILFNKSLQRRLIQLAGRYSAMTYTIPFTVSENDTARFIETTRSLKATDGIKFIPVSGYVISTFSGIIPIAKDDKVQITKYEQESNTVLFTFQVNKKKFRFPITIFILYLAIKSNNDSSVSLISDKRE